MAKEKFIGAMELVTLNPARAEQIGREVLSIAASALYWLEDTEFEDSAHLEMHSYGKYMRENLNSGCELFWNGSEYERRCPVDISHKRFGFSIGYVGSRMCGICGDDASECPHFEDTVYEVTGGPNRSGYCPVCSTKGCIEHLPENTYRVRPTIIVSIAEIFEVSIVSKPVQPDARLKAIPVDREKLIEALGPNFVYGETVNCDKCIKPCEGFETLPDDLPGDHPNTTHLVGTPVVPESADRVET